MTRPRVLFGEHSAQVPAIREHLDTERYDPTYGVVSEADLPSFDLVVPLRIEEIAAARAANADGRRRAAVPDAATVALCDDKLAFNRRLVASGFGALIPELLSDPPSAYPFVRKARFGDHGQGVRLVRSAADDVAMPDSFCQRAVPGEDEDVLHVLRLDGRVRFAVSYRYTMADALAVRGEADRPLATVPIDPAPALARCEPILDALGFEGLGCFNHKWVDGRPMIIELNPRFGGSLVGEVTGYLDAHLAATGG